MAYQWNRAKAAANLRKHGIDFADAVSVFSDDLAITIPDERFDEERFVNNKHCINFIIFIERSYCKDGQPGNAISPELFFFRILK